MESKLTNRLVFIFSSFSVLPDDIHDEKLLLKVDATETEPYLAMCLMEKGPIIIDKSLHPYKLQLRCTKSNDL